MVLFKKFSKPILVVLSQRVDLKQRGFFLDPIAETFSKEISISERREKEGKQAC